MSAAAPLPPRSVTARFRAGTIHADGFHFARGDEAAFDLVDGARLHYTPGPGWTGAMPAAFHGTVAALTLAWRGALPFHASTVELDGGAVMIAGTNGAGKSTLAAQLLALGARLVGDDLTVLDLPIMNSGPADNGPIVVRRGRPTIRLHRDTAARVAAEFSAPVADDARGKWLVRPAARSPAEALPLAGVLLLGEPDGALAPVVAATLLARQMFRPFWLRSVPGHAARLAGVLAIAMRVPVHGASVPAGFYADDRFATHIRGVIGAMRA